MEHVSNVDKIKGFGIDDTADIAINCEWVSSTNLVTHTIFRLPQGAFDSFEHENLPRSKYDIIVDETSNKPGQQAFEVSSWLKAGITSLMILSIQKLISGRYLGEILRLVICELIDEGVLFLGQNTYKLEVAYVFDTAFLSLMERSPLRILL